MEMNTQNQTTTKKRWVKPVMTRLQHGSMSKFGHNPTFDQRVRRHIAGVSIDDLVARYGSPLFVYDEKALRQKFRRTHSAFNTRYPNVTFGWSYKTNYLKAICSVFHQEGAWAEVVSEMEYEKARNLNVPGDKIIFNGPHKSIDALRTAVEENATINVDHFDEIADLEHLATERNHPINIGLRLNLDAGIHPQWSRFGFNLEGGQALEAAKRIQQGGRLRITGLHCHIGTYVLDPQAYARQIEKMVGFGYLLQDQFGMRMRYIDIGGGFPSQSRLKGSYLPPDVAVPSMDEFAEAIGEAMNHCLRPGDAPQLILESGRAMIDEAGMLITSIKASKRLPDGTRAYVADAGVNLLFTSFWYKFKIELDRETPGVNETAIIYGPMCMNIDAIDEGVLLPPLNRDQRLIFSPVGAYNNTQWLQFIEYRPNVVMVDEHAQVHVIREAEDLSDIERRECLPEHLKPKNGVVQPEEERTLPFNNAV